MRSRRAPDPTGFETGTALAAPSQRDPGEMRAPAPKSKETGRHRKLSGPRPDDGRSRQKSLVRVRALASRTSEAVRLIELPQRGPRPTRRRVPKSSQCDPASPIVGVFGESMRPSQLTGYQTGVRLPRRR